MDSTRMHDAKQGVSSLFLIKSAFIALPGYSSGPTIVTDHTLFYSSIV